MMSVIHNHKKRVLKQILFLGIINGVLLVPLYFVGAVTLTNPTNPLEGAGITTVGKLITALVNVIVQIGVPVAAFFIVYSGFLFVTARGNQGQLDKAKDSFFYTILGTAIILGAKIISDTISATIDSLK